MTELLFRDDPYARSCPARVAAVDARGIRLDRTVFYATGGGQPGDTGKLVFAGGATIDIVDTIKGELPDEVIHVPAPGLGLPEVGSDVLAEIDWLRRHRLMRMHTCLHLLCSLVPGAVTGGQVADGRGAAGFRRPRFEPRQGGDRRPTERADRRGASGSAARIDEAELAARPELVRTMSVKPPTGAGRVRVR